MKPITANPVTGYRDQTGTVHATQAGQLERDVNITVQNYIEEYFENATYDTQRGISAIVHYLIREGDIAEFMAMALELKKAMQAVDALKTAETLPN